MTDAEKKAWKKKMDAARAKKRKQREAEKLERLARIGAAPVVEERKEKFELGLLDYAALCSARVAPDISPLARVFEWASCWRKPEKEDARDTD